jgi:hypothetical protein
LLNEFRTRLSLLVTIVLACSSSLLAQAWVFPKGGGTVSVSYQNIFVRDHVFTEGIPRDTGHILSHAIILESDYSLTDHLAVKVALPYVASRYYGSRPHQLPMDDGKYHPTFQDFTFDVRYNLTNRNIALTPFFRSGIPSHDYQYFAHSAVGRDQREYQLGANVGRGLDPVLSKAYVQARYSYAVVQRVLGIRPNKSTVEAQAGYFLKPRLTLLGTTQWTHSHSGIELTCGPVIHCGLDDDHWIHHDQIAKSTLLDVGGGVAFSVNRSTDVFVSVARSVRGSNGHLHEPVASIGISRSFGNRFTIERATTKNGPAPVPQTAFVCTCAKTP